MQKAHIKKIPTLSKINITKTFVSEQNEVGHIESNMPIPQLGLIHTFDTLFA